jgi:hypothetical protein
MTLQEYMGDGAAPNPVHFALVREEAELVRFDKTEHNGRQGIMFPTRIPRASQTQMMESDSFKNGLASVIGDLGPYLEPHPVSFW